MIVFVVVVVDECADSLFKIPGEVVINKLDDVLHRMVPALDFPLGPRIIDGIMNMREFVIFDIVTQVIKNEHGTII
jgi:hypothetical protein